MVQLRRLKDRSGLSLDVLASKTGYSRSSWDRYLNGKALPPRHAVEELARVAGADPVRLLVLHEVAEEAWPQRIASSSPAGAEDDDEQGAAGEAAAEPAGAAGDSAASAEGPGAPGAEPSVLGAGQPPGVRRPVVLAAVVAAALVGMAAGMLIAAPWGDDDGGGTTVQTAQDGPLPSSSTTSTSTGAATGTGTGTGSGVNSNNTSTEGLGWYVFEPSKSYSCKVRRTGADGGELFAGFSATRTAVLAGPGWDVVEAQCLLGHHRMEPGIVDGVYGQQTIAAVMRLQKKAGLPADGVVGPHTWQVLRG